MPNVGPVVITAAGHTGKFRVNLPRSHPKNQKRISSFCFLSSESSFLSLKWRALTKLTEAITSQCNSDRYAHTLNLHNAVCQLFIKAAKKWTFKCNISITIVSKRVLGLCETGDLSKRAVMGKAVTAVPGQSFKPALSGQSHKWFTLMIPLSVKSLLFPLL